MKDFKLRTFIGLFQATSWQSVKGLIQTSSSVNCTQHRMQVLSGKGFFFFFFFSEVEWTGKVENNTVEFLAVAETRKAVFWPTSRLKRKSFASSGFSTEGPSFRFSQYPTAGA